MFCVVQFQAVMDELFLSFSNISVANFAELSGCVISWLEEHCKPQVQISLVAVSSDNLAYS